jgi:site-specific DNA-methyltransferase (adenine-specific)
MDRRDSPVALKATVSLRQGMGGDVVNRGFDLAGSLIHGDCYKILPTFPGGCIDVVLCDPPYGQAHEAYDCGTRLEVWKECYRVCADNAGLLAFTGNPTYQRTAGQIEAAGWVIQQMWGWVYRDGALNHCGGGFRRLSTAMTPIVFATKGSLLLPLEREGSPWERWGGQQHVFYEGETGKTGRTMPRTSASGHWPKSVVASEGVEGFQYFILSNTAIPDKRGQDRHPNYKPVWLLEWLLGKFPGKVVLDPFMGGGSVGKAAQRLGWNFVGIELSAGYFGMASRWLAEGD